MFAVIAFARSLRLVCGVLLFAMTPALWAATTVAVLDFELNDLSLLPGRASERQRTETLGPLLRDALTNTGSYTIVPVSAQRQHDANAGFGYLSTHPDAAAQLGREVGADWVVVGRLQKSNDLFAYLFAELINVHTERRLGEFSTEIKGPIVNHRLTERGVQRLAAQLHQGLTAIAAKRAPLE